MQKQRGAVGADRDDGDQDGAPSLSDRDFVLLDLVVVDIKTGEDIAVPPLKLPLLLHSRHSSRRDDGGNSVRTCGEETYERRAFRRDVRLLRALDKDEEGEGGREDAERVSSVAALARKGLGTVWQWVQTAAQGTGGLEQEEGGEQ